MRMGLEELAGMSPGAKGPLGLGGGADGFDPEIFNEFPEALHGIARIAQVSQKSGIM